VNEKENKIMDKLARFLRLASVVVAAAAFAAPSLAAQAQPEMIPPKVLVVYLGHIAPGKAMAAEKATVAIRDLFARAKWPTYWLTVLGVTGAERIAVYVGYPSFADWEKDNAAVEHDAKFAAALHREGAEWSAQMKESETIALKYVPELSYHPNVPVKGARYFTIDVVHVRLDKGHEFTEAEKMRIAAHVKAGINEHWAAYEVVAGQPEGTYVFFSPQASLAEWDKAEELHGKAYREAFGGEDNWKKFIGTLEASVKGVEMNLSAIDPRASYVSEDWIKTDPEFWAPKHAAPAAARKMAKKPAKK
jgi:hypothetical protein